MTRARMWKRKTRHPHDARCGASVAFPRDCGAHGGPALPAAALRSREGTLHASHVAGPGNDQDQSTKCTPYERASRSHHGRVEDGESNRPQSRPICILFSMKKETATRLCPAQQDPQQVRENASARLTPGGRSHNGERSLGRETVSFPGQSKCVEDWTDRVSQLPKLHEITPFSRCRGGSGH